MFDFVLSELNKKPEHYFYCDVSAPALQQKSVYFTETK